MKIQYTAINCVIFFQFVLATLILCPFAWIVALLSKIKNFDSNMSSREKILNVGIFIPFGLPIMLLNSMVDFFYFWQNSFRSDLEKIIAVKEPKTISHDNIRELLRILDKYSKNKVKSCHTPLMVRKFRKKFQVT